MIIVLSAACIICGLLGYAVFDSTAATSILLCAIGAVAIVVRLVLRKHLKRKLVAWSSFAVLCIAALLVSGFTGTAESDIEKSASAFREVDVLLDKGNAEKALKRLAEIKKEGGHYDDNTEICLREFKAYRLLSKEDDAVRALKKCTSFKDIRYYMALASTQLKAGNQLDALNTYIEAAALYPRHHEAQLKAGYLCFVRGAYARAEFYLLRACEIEPKDPDSLFFLGSVMYAQEKYPQAEGYLQRVLKLNIDETMKEDVEDLLASMPKGA